jgi:hypothetical protein
MEGAILQLGIKQRVNAGARDSHDLDCITCAGAPHESLYRLYHQHPCISGFHRTLNFSATQALKNCNKLIGKRSNIRFLQNLSMPKPVLKTLGKGHWRGRKRLVDNFCFIIPIQRPEGLQQKKRTFKRFFVIGKLRSQLL